MNNSPLKLDLDLVIHSTMSYTLTGSDRSGMSTPLSAATSTAMEEIRQPNVISSVRFNKGTVLKVKRARLIPDCPGLQPSDQGDYAGRMYMVQGSKGAGGTFTPTDDTPKVPLFFMKFDEWEEKEFEMRFAADNSDLGVGKGSYVTVSDFNVQGDWVGEEVGFRLELDAELYTGV